MTTETLTKIPPTPVEITDHWLAQFSGLIAAGVEAWLKAGKLLVQMVEENPNTYAVIMKHDPRISVDMLLCFERIGRGEIYPQLLLDNSPGTRRLIGLPYNLQCKYAREKVPVVISVRDGKPTVEERNIHQLTKKEVEIVFSTKGIRTVDEQADVVAFQNRPSVARPIVQEKKTKSIGFFKFVLDGRGVAKLEMVPASDKLCDFVSKRFTIEKDKRGGISSEVFEVKKEI